MSSTRQRLERRVKKMLTKEEILRKKVLEILRRESL